MNMNRLRYISFSVLMALSTLTLAQNQNDADGDFIDRGVDKAKEKTNTWVDDGISDILGSLGDIPGVSVVQDVLQNAAHSSIDNFYDNLNDRVSELLNSTQHPREELEKRHLACKAIAEKVKEDGRLFKSIRDIAVGKSECPLPIGIKSTGYALYIDKVYSKDPAGDTWIDACAFIKFADSNCELSFVGSAIIEGESGIGTAGTLKLVKNCELPLGHNCSIIFKEGTQLRFGCEGVEKVSAKMSFVMKDASIYGIDNAGRSTGRLCFDFESEFTDFEDFTASLNISQKFRIQNVDQLTFTLNDLTLDHSYTETPSSVQFPDNYFASVDNTGDASLSEQNKKAWRGVAIKLAKVELSGFFNNMNETSTKEFTLNRAIIDGQGFSGKGETTNLISDASINTSKWDMSINDFIIELFKGKIVTLGFKGKLNAPPFGEASLLDYKAEYETAQKTFVFDASLTKKAPFNIFCAEMEFDPGSNVEIKIHDGGIWPKIQASGKISIDAPINVGSSAVILPSLKFQNMVLQRATPHIQLGTFAFDGGDIRPSFGGFELSIRDIIGVASNVANGIRNNNGIQNGLQNVLQDGIQGGIDAVQQTVSNVASTVEANLPNMPNLPNIPNIPDIPNISLPGESPVSISDVSATDAGMQITTEIKLNDQFAGKTKITLIGNGESWKIKKVKLDEVDIDYDGGAFALKGGVAFFDSDEVYGKGFHGNIDMSLLNGQYKLKAAGTFGKVSSNRYFMTDALFETKPTPGSGIIVGPVAFTGFGGGIYYHMTQTTNSVSNEYGKALSGINYIPDDKVGLGFLASAKFGLSASPDMFNAQVGFEMQFNSTWGVNFVSLTGDARFVSPAIELSGVTDNLKSAVKDKLASKLNGAMADKLSDRFNKYIDQELGKKPSIGGAITAKMAMNFDFQNDVYNADFQTFMDWGILKGIGENGKMGWAKAYLNKGDDKDWYVYIGTPSDPIGLKLLSIAESRSYFMMGHHIPDMEAPPQEVTTILQKYASTLDTKSENIDGKGIAFGSSFRQDLNVQVMPFYASLGIGIGADMVIKNYGPNAHCAGTPPPLGINGWFATAQAWSYITADAGMYFKLFKKEKKFSFAKFETAAALRGSGPNPLYLAGSFGGNFSILGGLVKGKFELPFAIGEKCDIRGGSPFGDMEVIKQLTPSESSDDVDVFIAPQLVLNIPIDEEMEIEDDDNTVWMYKVNLDEFDVKTKNGGMTMIGNLGTSSDNRVCTLDLDEPLDSKTQYVVHAKVSFQRKNKYGKWEVLLDDDTRKPVVEERTVEFTSGTRPKSINPAHILCSYPKDGQYNFYINEHDKAYLATSVNYAYLFRKANDKGEGIPEGYNQVARLITKQSSKAPLDVTFKVLSNAESNKVVPGSKTYIEVNIDDLKLVRDEVYNISILNLPKDQKNSFKNIEVAEKKVDMEGQDVTMTEVSATSDLALLETVEIVSTDFRTSKYFSFVEKMNGFAQTKVTAEYVFAYANDIVVNLSNQEGEAFDKTEKSYIDDDLVVAVPDYNRTPWYTESVAPLYYGNSDVIRLIGKKEPPVNTIEVRSNNKDYQLEEEAQKPMDSRAFVHNNSAYKIWNELLVDRAKVINAVVDNNLRTEKLEKFTQSYDIPFMPRGNYPVVFKYIIPGKKIETSTYNMDINWK